MNYYINKSIKGSSIISNLNVENSFITNTNITNELANAYDIGSILNPFRIGYFQDVSVNGNTLQNYIKSLFTATNPITYTDGLIGININSTKLEIVDNELSVKDSYTKSLFSATNPITYVDGLIGLNINTTKLEIVDNELSIKDSYTKSLFSATNPITYADGLIGLNFDTAQFSIDGSNRLSFDYTIPFEFNASGLELNYNTNQFDLTGNQLNLKIDSPLSFETGKLDLKLKQTIDTSGFAMNKLFVSAEGELDINLSSLIQPGNGISKLSYLDMLTDFGFSYIPGVDGLLPEIEFISADIDITVLDFKAGKISIKSQGHSRVPYFNAFGLISDSNFYFDDASNELYVDRITLTDPVSSSSLNTRATTKAYVDNLNTYASTSALFYTQDGSTRVWDIRLNPDFLGLDANEKLITKITGAPNKAISVSPDNKIILSYNTAHFREAADGKLESALISKMGSCIVLDANYDLDIDIELADLVVIANKLGLSTVFKGKITTLETKATTLEATVATHTGEIATLTGAVATNSTLISGALASITAQGVVDVIHSADLAGLHNFIDATILPNLTSLNSSVDTINTSLSNTTGTGAFVLQTSPTLITPVLGIATGTSLNLSGNLNSLTHTITGSTSGVITIQGQAVAGTYNFNLPTTSGTAGQVLTSGGGVNAPMTWSTPNTGTITSVAVSVPSFLTVSGSPITSSGTIAISATSTGSGSVVLQTSPILITPVLGIATGTSLNLSGNLNSLTHTITGSTSGIITIQGQATAGTYNFNLPTTSGTAGQVLTSGGGVNAPMTWSTPNTGTITSVAISVPSFLSVSGSPITSSGTIAISGSSTGSGSVVLQTSPTLITPVLGIASGTSLNLSGNLNSLTHTITGSTSGIITIQGQATAGTYNFNLPTTSGTAGQVLTSGGGVNAPMTWSTPNTGTITSVAVSVPSFLTVSGSPITSSGTIAISATSTGSGSVVLQTSPILITPVLGIATGTSLNLSANMNSLTASITSTSSSTSTTTGALTVAGGLGVAGVIHSNGIDTTNNAGAGGWSYIGSNLNGLAISGSRPGFGFGWNQSAGLGENIMTYFTGAGGSPRLDVCSWDGTTRTVRMSMNNVGFTTFNGPLLPADGVIIQNTQDGGLNRGIYMWQRSDTNWAIYMGTAGASRSIAGGTTVASPGFSSHSIRFRVNGTSSNGFIFENASEAHLLSIRANDGAVFLSGLIAQSIAGTTGQIFMNSLMPSLATGQSTALVFGKTNTTNGCISLRYINDASPYIGLGFWANDDILRIRTTGELQLTNAVINRKLVLYDTLNNDNQYYGLGVNSGILRYQTDNTGADHVFYAGVNSTTSNELCRIKGNGSGITSSGLVITNDTTPNITVRTSPGGEGSLYLGNSGHGVKRVGNDVIVYTAGGTSVKLQTDGGDRLISNATNTTINGNLIVNGTFRSTVNWSCYRMTGDSGWPNASDTTCGNWYELGSAGEKLTLSGGNFTNNLGRDIYITVSWCSRRSSNGFGDSHFWILQGGYRWAKHDTTGVAEMTVCATIGMSPGTVINLQGWQTSGSGNNFHSGTSMATMIIH